MSFQDFWAVGAKCYFKRDTLNGQKFPLLDLGVVTNFSPTIEPTRIDLFDPASGISRLVASTVTQINEEWALTLANLSPNNRSLLFMSDLPENITYTAEERDVSHPTELFVGGLLGILDADGERAIPVASIAALYGGTLDTVANTITAINVATRTLTVTTDFTAILSPGDPIIIHPTGLADVTHAGTYQVLSTTSTTIVLATDLKGAANETGVTVDLSHNQTSAAVIGIEGTDWTPYDLAMGIVKSATTWSIPSGSLEIPINVRVLYQTKALTGRRLIRPQSIVGNLEGEMFLVMSRGNNAFQTLRKAKVSLSPGASTFGNDAYSTVVLNARVLSDLTEVDVAGTMLDFTGDIPTFS